MRPLDIFAAAAKFRQHLAKEAQQADSSAEPAPKEEINYNQIAAELNSVVEGFIARNPLKMATTRRPNIRQASQEQDGQVAIGFIVPFNEYKTYIREMNNEIQKLQKKYPGVNLYAYYDTKDPRKAKL